MPQTAGRPEEAEWDFAAQANAMVVKDAESYYRNMFFQGYLLLPSVTACDPHAIRALCLTALAFSYEEFLPAAIFHVARHSASLPSAGKRQTGLNLFCSSAYTERAYIMCLEQWDLDA